MFWGQKPPDGRNPTLCILAKSGMMGGIRLYVFEPKTARKGKLSGSENPEKQNILRVKERISGINIMLGLPIHKEESPPEEHSDFIFSIIQPSKQHAEIICEANRNLRLQASYGHPKPSYGHPKPAYVHPKAANGDFTKPREQFYKGTGRSSEGCQEGCFRLLPPIPRGSACGKEHIKAIITPAFMPSEATCHQTVHTTSFSTSIPS